MATRRAPIKSLAQAAALGRNGDTMLAHISPEEAYWASRAQGGMSINPDTGLPEFFSLGGVLKSVAKAAGAIVGGYFGGPAGAALGAGAATKLTGGSWQDALGTGLVSGIGAYGVQQSGLTGDWGGGFDRGTGWLGQSTPASSSGSGGLGSAIGSLGSGGSGGGLSLSKLLPIAGVAVSALAGTPKQPKVQTGDTSQPGYSGPTGPDWSTYQPLDRQNQPYYGDYLTYGQDGGEHQFYDTVNPAPQFKKGGGPISAADRQKLNAAGRNGDDELVHTNAKERAVLKGIGGAGTINPKTGFKEYYSDSSHEHGADSDHDRPGGGGIAGGGGGSGGNGGNGGGFGAGPGGSGNENAASGVTGHDYSGSMGPAGSYGGGNDDGSGAVINRMAKNLTPDQANKMFAGSLAKATMPGSGETLGTQKGAQTPGLGNAALNAIGGIFGVHSYPDAVSSYDATTGTTTLHDFTKVDPVKAALGVAGMFNSLGTLASIGYTGLNKLGIAAPNYGFVGHDVLNGGWSTGSGSLGSGSGDTGSAPQGSNPHDAGSMNDAKSGTYTQPTNPVTSVATTPTTPTPVQDPATAAGATPPYGRQYLGLNQDPLTYGQNSLGENQFWTPFHYAAGGPTSAQTGIGGFQGPVSGAGGGQDDLIDARLADGEHVFDADTVSQIGDGSNKEGHRKLEEFKKNLRTQKRSAPTNKIPPKTKALSSYMKSRAA